MPRPRDWQHSLIRDLATGLTGGLAASVVVWLAYLAVRWLT
jgi:hypothetical protein